MSTDVEWAESLVGRDWEIFWESNGCHDNITTIEAAGAEPPEEEQEQQPEDEEKSDSDNDEQDISDWYDGRIISYALSEQQPQGVIFKIRFVGDDQVYTMPLSRSLVRPSARAWLVRTKAILSSDSKNTLPVDTAMLEDNGHLDRLRSNITFRHEPQDQHPPAPLNFSSSTEHNPNVDQFNQIQMLRYHTQVQCYLRTKLARIVDVGEKTADEPTEAYVNFLVLCLQRVQACCEWYSKCWTLWEHVFLKDHDEMTTSDQLNLEDVQKDCVEEGHPVIVRVLTMDITHTGIQRQPRPSSTSHGTRRTKRRRIQRDHNMALSGGKSQTSTDEDEFLFDELDDARLFLGKMVDRFVKKAKSRAHRWFEIVALDMLSSICRHIHDPLIQWTRNAEYILGERKESDDESSAGKTSVEEREDGNTSDISMESEEQDEKMYSYQDAKEALDEVPTNQVLAKFDLSKWMSKLRAKLDCIEGFEQDAWKVICQLADEAEIEKREEDPILFDLTRLTNQAMGAEVLLANVEPLGVSTSSKLTKEVIQDALTIRQWVVDLIQAEHRRERVVFIQNVVTRASTLPHLPPLPKETPEEVSLSTKLAQIVGRVQSVSSKLFSNVHLVRQYERNLAESYDTATDAGSLRTIAGIELALAELSSIPVLSLIEEKLVVRRDLITWVERVRRRLDEPDDTTSFADIDNFYKMLTNILSGMSPGRNKLIAHLSAVETIDKEMRQFARTDAVYLSQGIVPRLEALYRQAAGWKERAEAIVYSLRVHGNAVAGDAVLTSKPSAMVDCKRMADLLQEYHGFDVTIAAEHDVIQAVYDETTVWSQRINHAIANEQDLLTCLLKFSEARPKGVIVDPARHVVDVIIEMLRWHDSVKILASKLGIGNGEKEFSGVLELVADGIECIVRYAKHNQAEVCFMFEPAECLEIMSTLFGFQRTTKGLVLSKIEATAAGSTIFRRVISTSFDANDGHPMLLLLRIVWALHVAAFVQKTTSQECTQRPSLQEAKALAAKDPNNAKVDMAFQKIGPLSSAVDTLKSLIEESQGIEEEAKKLATPDKERFRGSIEKTAEVREYLSCLKKIQASFKSPKQGGAGLTLNVEIEKSVDQLAKDLSWIERTFAFPLLHSHLVEVPDNKRVPFDVLVRLYERIPAIGDVCLGDMPMLVLRVKELHDAAEVWQQAVTSLLSLSIRGAKRRHAGSAEIESEVKESQPKVHNVELEDLVKDSILNAVAIPREDAVREVFNNAREFETLMYELLGKDFSDGIVDKSSYPDAISLVGIDGEFHLYRLTGSPLFYALKASVDRIGILSADIAADTPGKEAFDWIVKCVEWIETLNNAVTTESPFGNRDKLVVPAEATGAILELGNQLFLEISDDIRRTLSTYRILLSTNRQAAKLTVTIGKGGAHHSTGGTALKWCPLIFDWLRQDVENFRDWEKRANEVLARCSEAVTRMENLEEIEQNDVNVGYSHFEDVKLLLHEGNVSNVVVPTSQHIEMLRQKQRMLEEWVHRTISDSKGSLSLKAAKMDRYKAASVILDRDEFLDSLLSRRRIMPNAKREKVAAEEIREKAQAKLEQLMIKGMHMMGLKIAGASDVGLHCAIRAWEIEAGVCSKYWTGSKQEGEYNQKLRSIVNNLDPCTNTTLCARVLSDELTVDGLLEMTPAALASPALRSKRDDTEQVGKNPSIATGAKAKTQKQKGKTIRGLLASVTSAQFPKQTSPGTLSSKPVSSLTVTPSEHIAAPPPPVTPVTPATPATSSGRQSPLSLAAAVQAAQRLQLTAPPPPPPPLLLPLSTPAASHVRRSMPVESKNGNDTFSFTINGNTFQGKLEIENGAYPSIDGFLPDALSNNPGGRSAPDAFTAFLDGKLKSDNWTVILMRLSVCGGSAFYKRFYKEFESKDRIVMCILDDGKESKLFLVTPKFHSTTKSIRHQLTKRGSSYAVLITRHVFFDD